MATTPDLGLLELTQGQANPDITFNTSIRLMQALQNGVIDRTNNPPGSPSEQDAYLIGTAPTGVWTGKANLIAVYIGGEWKYIPGNDDTGTQISMGARQEGLQVYVRDEDITYTWRALATSPATFAWAQVALSASAVTNTPAGNIAATTVQDAINELDSEKIAIAGHSAVSVVGRSANSAGNAADIAAASNGQYLNRRSNALSFDTIPASDVVNTPAGNISSTTVQAALNELDTEKASYEEGTFTPAYTFATVGDLSVSYSKQNGYYIKVGNLVFAFVDLQGTLTHSTAAGGLRVTGLPFTSVLSTHLGITTLALTNSGSVALPANAANLFGQVFDNNTIAALRVTDQTGIRVDIGVTHVLTGANLESRMVCIYRRS